MRSLHELRGGYSAAPFGTPEDLRRPRHEAAVCRASLRGVPCPIGCGGDDSARPDWAVRTPRHTFGAHPSGDPTTAPEGAVALPSLERTTAADARH